MKYHIAYKTHKSEFIINTLGLFQNAIPKNILIKIQEIEKV